MYVNVSVFPLVPAIRVVGETIMFPEPSGAIGTVTFTAGNVDKLAKAPELLPLD